MHIVIPPDVLQIIARLEGDGYEAFLVGGCVRDSLLSKSPSDYDIATNGVPEEIARVFSDRKLLHHGEKHGTVGVVTNRRVVEITTYRVDGPYSDGRRPDTVMFTPSLKEDLRRRDFTVNALAYHPKWGVVDVFGGQADLRAKLVRCVGNPKARYSEDALRILRAFRFASVLGFDIEPDTERRAILMRESLDRISRERIRTELEKLLLGESVAHVLMRAKQIIEVCIPRIKSAHSDIYETMCDEVAKLPRRLDVRFTALLLLLPPEDHKEAMAGLKFSNALSEAVSRRIQAMDVDYGTSLSLKKAMGQFGFEAVLDGLYIREAKGHDVGALIHEARSLDEDGACVTIHQLAVGGRDIIQMGIPPGEKVGQILSSLLERVMANELPNRREALLGAIRTFL